MKDIFIKWFMALNAFLIRLSRGRIGGKLGTQTILILHTIGRRSGQERSLPIAYFEYEGSYLIVGSNWGKPKDADWVLNLKKDPRASLEIRGKRFAALARQAVGDEYEMLWKLVTGRHPPYLKYGAMTSRPIPIMIFEPDDRRTLI